MLLNSIALKIWCLFQNPEPEIPEYEALNIQMRGYDYVTLESFAKFAHSFVKNLGLESDAWVWNVQVWKIYICFLPEASFGLQILSMPVSVCQPRSLSAW